MSLDKYFRILEDHGANLAIEISPADIRIEPWTIMKCRYGCPNYGRNRSCPPFAPTWQQMRDIAACYGRAILFRTADMHAGTPAALACADALSADGFYKAVAFGTGPCRLCKQCTVEACPRPSRVAPSPEACGIDVVATVRGAGLEISMPPVPGQPLNCYGLILVD